ncbi:MAG TPA: cytochrome c [Burkholderiales bacterium]|nr:cytochrome c [Burkholderiales bacterium]
MINRDMATWVAALRVTAAVGAACLATALPLGSFADEVKPSSPMTRYETPKGTAQEAGAPTSGQPGKVADGNTSSTGQPDAEAKAPPFSVHATFSNICGFCHEDGGRRAGKGPQLMGTEKTDEQIFERIKFGKPGRMAAFGGAFTDDQIKQIVVYIRNLKPR